MFMFKVCDRSLCVNGESADVIEPGADTMKFIIAGAKNYMSRTYCE